MNYKGVVLPSTSDLLQVFVREEVGGRLPSVSAQASLVETLRGMDGLSDSVILRLAITVIHKTNLLMERGLRVGEFQCYIGENTLESCLEILSSILPNVFSVGGPLPLIKFNIPGGVLTTLKRYIEIRSLMDPGEDFESLLLELTIGSFDDKILTLHSSYTSRRAAGVVMEMDDGELTESERDESDEEEDVGEDIAVVPEKDCTGVRVEFGDAKEGDDFLDSCGEHSIDVDPVTREREFAEFDFVTPAPKKQRRLSRELHNLQMSTGIAATDVSGRRNVAVRKPGHYNVRGMVDVGSIVWDSERGRKSSNVPTFAQVKSHFSKIQLTIQENQFVYPQTMVRGLKNMAKPIDPVKLDSSLKDPVRFMAFLRAWKQQFNMVHSMNAKPQFEDLIGLMVSRCLSGVYAATSGGADRGLDGIIKVRTDMEDYKVLLNVKRWENKSVGRDEMHKFIGAIEDYKTYGSCDTAWGVMVSWSGYTTHAIEVAKNQGIIILDRTWIHKVLVEMDLSEYIPTPLDRYLQSPQTTVGLEVVRFVSNSSRTANGRLMWGYLDTETVFRSGYTDEELLECCQVISERNHMSVEFKEVKSRKEFLRRDSLKLRNSLDNFGCAPINFVPILKEDCAPLLNLIKALEGIAESSRNMGVDWNNLSLRLEDKLPVDVDVILWNRYIADNDIPIESLCDSLNAIVNLELMNWLHFMGFPEGCEVIKDQVFIRRKGMLGETPLHTDDAALTKSIGPYPMDRIYTFNIHCTADGSEPPSRLKILRNSHIVPHYKVVKDKVYAHKDGPKDIALVPHYLISEENFGPLSWMNPGDYGSIFSSRSLHMATTHTSEDPRWSIDIRVYVPTPAIHVLWDNSTTLTLRYISRLVFILNCQLVSSNSGDLYFLLSPFRRLLDNGSMEQREMDKLLNSLGTKGKTLGDNQLIEVRISEYWKTGDDQGLSDYQSSLDPFHFLNSDDILTNFVWSYLIQSPESFVESKEYSLYMQFRKTSINVMDKQHAIRLLYFATHNILRVCRYGWRFANDNEVKSLDWEIQLIAKSLSSLRWGKTYTNADILAECYLCLFLCNMWTYVTDARRDLGKFRPAVTDMEHIWGDTDSAQDIFYNSAHNIWAFMSVEILLDFYDRECNP